MTGVIEDMARMKTDPDEETDQNCIFCLIASDRDASAVVLKKDEELVCFKDIFPAAPHHYLVVPRQHIVNCDSLHKGHVQLVKRMAELGKAVLQEQGVTDMMDIRLGFHKPPYTSVDHLHLHVLAPGSQIPIQMAFKFIPGSHRFITVSSLQKHLASVSLSSLCHLDSCQSIQ